MWHLEPRRTSCRLRSASSARRRPPLGSASSHGEAAAIRRRRQPGDVLGLLPHQPSMVQRHCWLLGKSAHQHALGGLVLRPHGSALGVCVPRRRLLQVWSGLAKAHPPLQLALRRQAKLFRTCRGKGGLCSKSYDYHTHLAGKTFIAHTANPYPARLCKRFVGLLIEQLQISHAQSIGEIARTDLCLGFGAGATRE